MNSKELKYYLFGSVVTVVVFFATIELATRTISWIAGSGFTLGLGELEPHDPGIRGIYQWHPFTGLTFRPNIIFEGAHPYRKGRVTNLVDQHGLLAKGQTLSISKTDEEIRIAAIGASTTAGIGLSFEENWPGRLGSLIQQALPDKRVTIINGGVPGFDTAQSIANLALRIIPFNPDVVIIYHAYNDLKAVRANVEFKPDYSHIHDIPYGYREKPFVLVRWLNRSMVYVRVRNEYRERVKEYDLANLTEQSTRLSAIPGLAEHTFEQHIRTLVAIARSDGAKVVLSSFATLHNPRRDYSKRDNIVNLGNLQKNQLPDLLRFTPGLTIAGIFDGINRYNTILERVANEEGTGWVDNAKKIPHRDEFFLDRVHFSPKGAARMAENLLPVILKQLGR